ncbi:DUF6230 family protein [Streptomyces caatingaensis]|uniref:Cholesterol esterase n=1 Tax=Streptomyces caatingaensis TaxID=1678637 RepID=A0A0K9XC28_9ACTN|nr:DUF6230 family protein [Streptomyces caatingaensis]KNB50980.1 cholesterol esterase [Streptomyces caatingaensis]
MKSQARGGTRWKRFAVVMVPSVGAAAAVTMAIAQGALAASFSVSGQQFQIEAGEMRGKGFVQYGSLDQNKQGAHPVVVVGVHEATISNLCQSVSVRVPVINKDVSMKLRAGQGPDEADKVKAGNLYIDADILNANAKFEDIDIGVPVDNAPKGPGPAKGDHYVPGSFAQQAKSVVFTNAKQQAWATSAGTFELKGLKMDIKFGKNECFDPKVLKRPDD